MGLQEGLGGGEGSPPTRSCTWAAWRGSDKSPAEAPTPQSCCLGVGGGAPSLDSRGDWGKLRGQSCLRGLHSWKGTAEGLLGLYNLFPPPPPHQKNPTSVWIIPPSQMRNLRPGGGDQLVHGRGGLRAWPVLPGAPVTPATRTPNARPPPVPPHFLLCQKFIRSPISWITCVSTLVLGCREALRSSGHV